MLTRRELLQRSGLGFGGLALAGLMAETARGSASNPMSPRAPHFPARAKHVIHVFLNGRDIRDLGGMDMPIPEDAQVRIFPPVGGG